MNTPFDDEKANEAKQALEDIRQRQRDYELYRNNLLRSRIEEYEQRRKEFHFVRSLESAADEEDLETLEMLMHSAAVALADLVASEVKHGGYRLTKDV
jgi:hypothetical protein